MSIDTLVYEKKNNQARIAALASGEMRELEIVDFPTACVAVSQMSGGYISWNDGNRCGKCVVF